MTCHGGHRGGHRDEVLRARCSEEDGRHGGGRHGGRHGGHRGGRRGGSGIESSRSMYVRVVCRCGSFD